MNPFFPSLESHRVFAGFLALTVGCALAKAEEPWRPLWNGKDLTGWTTWMIKPHPSAVIPGMEKDAKGEYTAPIGLNRDPLGVFTVVQMDGQPAIRISGQSFGGMRCTTPLSNYRLKLQFKWGEKKWAPRDKPETPRDSGLLYHVHTASGAEGRTWERSVELQIQEGDVGDLYAVGSAIFVKSTPSATNPKPVYHYDPNGKWRVFSQEPGFEGRCIKQPDAENPSGQWNDVELVCLGEESIHIVNGKVVMRLHGAMRLDTPTPQSLTAGEIVLQTEGAEVFYRNISWQPITAIPAQYAP